MALLPDDPKERKQIPIASGVLDYFPAALAEIAKISYAGNQQHNPGQPLHWARNKSTDQDDTIVRHFLDRGGIDTDGQRHSAKLAWRALAFLQLELEADGAPVARGAVYADTKRDTDWAYLAAFLDGEGGIGIVRRESKRSEGYYLRVTLYNTDRAALVSLHEKFGGYIPPARNRNPKHAPGSSLIWSHKAAGEILEKVLPYLKVKKDRAILALTFQDAVAEIKGGRAKKLPRKTAVQLRSFKRALHRMNKKGPKTK